MTKPPFGPFWTPPLPFPVYGVGLGLGVALGSGVGMPIISAALTKLRLPQSRKIPSAVKTGKEDSKNRKRKGTRIEGKNAKETLRREWRLN